MKLKLCLAFLTAMAFAPLASADTELRITGSTAFRAAVHNALLNSFFSAAPAYAHNGATAGSVTGAGRSIFRGSHATLGVVTVRCSWSGSAGGIEDLTTGRLVSFIPASALPGSGEAFNQTTTESLPSLVAMSDVSQNSTAFLTPSLEDNSVGVVPFTWVVNDTSATGTTLQRYGFEGVTAQFVRALYTAGQASKYFLTGNPADSKFIFPSGRDTSSGTRITMLAETKYGVFKPLQQFQITAASDAVTELRVWPTTGSGADALPGNGGYTSGGTLSGLLASKSDSSFVLKNAAGTTVGTIPGAHIISCVGLADSNTVVNGGGARLKYEGVGFDGTSEAENDKVRYGTYTMWGYQHMLNGTLSTDQASARDSLITAIDSNVAGVGIALSTMIVSRQEDGGVVGE